MSSERAGPPYLSGEVIHPVALVLAAVLGAVLLVEVLLAALGQPSVIWTIRDILRGEVTTLPDSWKVMLIARDWLQANPEADGQLYKQVFFTQHHKFQYAPTSLLPFELFGIFGAEPTIQFLNSLNLGVLFLTALAMGYFCWMLPKSLNGGAPLGAEASRARLLFALVAPVATLLFFPVVFAYQLGQLQAWINLLFVGACIAWFGGHRGTAGFLIGLICLLKPQFGLFAVWALLRHEWRFAAALIAAGATGLVISIALYGFGNHLAYLEVLSFLSSHGEAYWANQSANGLLHRIFGNGEFLSFDANGFPPFHPGVYVGTLAVTVLLISTAFCARRGQSSRAPLYDFLLAALAFTIASPIAWEHHYGVLLPMLAVLAITLTGAPPKANSAWLVGGLAVAFVLSALPLTPVRFMEGPLHILQSYFYFVALGLMIALWRLTRGRWHLPPISDRAGAL